MFSAKSINTWGLYLCINRTAFTYDHCRSGFCRLVSFHFCQGQAYCEDSSVSQCYIVRSGPDSVKCLNYVCCGSRCSFSKSYVKNYLVLNALNPWSDNGHIEKLLKETLYDSSVFVQYVFWMCTLCMASKSQSLQQRELFSPTVNTEGCWNASSWIFRIVPLRVYIPTLVTELGREEGGRGSSGYNDSQRDGSPKYEKSLISPDSQIRLERASFTHHDVSLHVRCDPCTNATLGEDIRGN